MRDVRSRPVKRVAAAVGEGSMAIAFIRQYLGARRLGYFEWNVATKASKSFFAALTVFSGPVILKKC